MRHHPLWFRPLSFLAAMVQSRLSSSSAAYIVRPSPSLRVCEAPSCRTNKNK